MFKKLIASHQARRRVSWLIAAILILPFVIFFHATGQAPSRGPGGAAGELFGRSVPWETFQEQRGWLLTQWRNQFGDALDAMGPFITQSTWDRLILLEEAGRRRLRVGDQELAAAIHKIPAFQDGGRFIPERYHRYVSAVGTTPQAFERLLRSDLLIEKLVGSVKAAVAISDDDVRQAYARQHEQLQATVIFFGAAAFEEEAVAALTEESLRAHYDAHPDALRIPEQIVVEYAGASREELAAQLQVDEAAVGAFYDSHPDEFTNEDGTLPPLEEVREAVRERAANERARKQLTALALDLEDDLAARRPFDEIVAARALQTKTAGPLAPGSFQAMDGWIAEGFDPAILQAAASLAEGQISDVIETGDGIYLARVTQRLAARLPPFEDLREAIRAQLIHEGARALARARATALHEHLQRQLKAGVRFEEAVLRSGKIPAAPAVLTRAGAIASIGDAPAVTEEAFRTPLGTPTGVLDTPAGFALIRPETLIPADFSGFAAVEAALRQQTLTDAQSARVSQWLTDLRGRANLRSFVESSAQGS